MTEKRDPADPPEADSRIAPDPFAAVLPAIAALGTISSIAAINWAGRERAADRIRPKRKAVMVLRELETCCLHLSEIFRRFQRNPRLFAGEGAQGSSPLKFGVHGPRVGTDAAKLFAAPVGKEVADNAMQVLGGWGYCNEYKVERFLRDAKLLEIGGGTLESHQKNLTKELTRKFATSG